MKKRTNGTGIYFVDAEQTGNGFICDTKPIEVMRALATSAYVVLRVHFTNGNMQYNPIEHVKGTQVYFYNMFMLDDTGIYQID